MSILYFDHVLFTTIITQEWTVLKFKINTNGKFITIIIDIDWYEYFVLISGADTGAEPGVTGPSWNLIGPWGSWLKSLKQQQQSQQQTSHLLKTLTINTNNLNVLSFFFLQNALIAVWALDLSFGANVNNEWLQCAPYWMGNLPLCVHRAPPPPLPELENPAWCHFCPFDPDLYGL